MNNTFSKKVIFISILLATLVPIAALLIQYLSSQREQKKDAEVDGKEKTQVITQLDYISKTLEELRIDIKASDRQRELMNGDIIRLQEFQRRAENGIKSHDERIFELEKMVYGVKARKE